MRYVEVKVTTSFFAPATISYSNAGVLGDGMNTELPSEPFLLTKPSGDNFDKINTASPLYQAVVDYFSQPNTTNLWVMNTPSEGAKISHEPMIPISDTNDKQFQIQTTNIDSIDGIYEMKDNTLTLVDPSEYSANLTTGVVTFTSAKTSDMYATYNIDALGYGLKKLRDKDIQVEFIAGETNIENLQRLIDEVELASACQRFRIAVGMMPSGQILDSTYLGHLSSLRSHRFVYVAHKCTDTDAAAAVAGAICGNEPNQNMTLRTVYCDQDPNDPFSDTEEYAFWQNQVLALQPNRWVGNGVYCLHGFNMSPSSTNKWIDFVRTNDYLSLLIISTLTNPNIIGDVPYTMGGMRTLKAYIRSAMRPALIRGYISSIDEIIIPIESIIAKGNSASDEEKQYLLNLKSHRIIEDIVVVFTYPASPDKIYLEIKSQ